MTGVTAVAPVLRAAPWTTMTLAMFAPMLAGNYFCVRREARR